MSYLYSTLSFHYIFKPKQFDFDSLNRYLDRMEFFKPKYIGFKMTEEEYESRHHQANTKKSPRQRISRKKWTKSNITSATGKKRISREPVIHLSPNQTANRKCPIRWKICTIC